MFRYLTIISTFLYVRLVVTEINPAKCFESEMREACRGKYQQKHAFFTLPDRWSDTLSFSNQDLVKCLDSKPRWIHFAGDSTSRNLFSELLTNYYNVSTNYLDNGLPHELSSKPTKISWAFKGKWMKSYSNVAYDVNNEIFHNMSVTKNFPDVLFIGIGAHELMSWSGRKSPIVSVDIFIKETDEFLALLEKWSFFNNSKTAVYFTNMNSLRGWRISFDAMSNLRDYACEQQKYACRAFRAKGARVIDMFGISNERPDLADKAGLHYHRPVVTEQVKSLIYDVCKSEAT